MSDVFVPGLRSRFNSEQIVEDLMRVERIPRDRTERNIENHETRKTYWQDLGRRMTSLRDSARLLFSFQNPFNDRVAVSSDENVISATATREAIEQDYRFSVKQLAQADRFLSPPLDERTRVEEGNYTFHIGNDEVSFNFRGGTLREFVDALNRRGRDKIGASLITVQPGTRSLLLESKVTGAENHLDFSGDAALLAVRLGLAELANNSRRELPINEETVREAPMQGSIQPTGPIAIDNGVLELPSFASASLPFGLPVEPGSPFVLRIETATNIRAESALGFPMPPPGPSIPTSGSVSYGGITIENNPSTAPLPEWNPPPIPQRMDNLAVFSLSFTDGSRVQLEPISDSGTFIPWQFNLAEVAAGRTITALNIDNQNTHRDISVRSVVVLDPNAVSGSYRPLNPVSTAQDAIISMEGIEMIRPSNVINDIVPGVTITARGVSERPVRLDVSTDREGVKDAIINLVGNYNLLMAELNVLTRSDPRIIDDLGFLDREEAEEMRQRLGVFSGESTLTQFRNNMLRAVTSPYPTDAERDLALLSQIGIGTNVLGTGGAGINPSQMRGYLEINPRTLDAALEHNLHEVRQLFGSDTSGDMIIDTGVAFNLDAMARPFVEIGGIISLKTGTIDSQISQDRRRIETMDRQLAAKETELRIQYNRMEAAYARMEQMQSSLDNFSQRNNNR